VFWPQESAKTFYRSDFWMCSLCQKVFPQHIFLDLHLARRHYEQIYTVLQLLNKAITMSFIS
jgi:hypothetical protein